MSVDVYEAPIAAQSWFVLNRIRDVARECGGGVHDVVRLVQYFRDLRHYPTYNRVRGLFLPRAGGEHGGGGQPHAAVRRRSGGSGSHAVLAAELSGAGPRRPGAQKTKAARRRLLQVLETAPTHFTASLFGEGVTPCFTDRRKSTLPGPFLKTRCCARTQRHACGFVPDLRGGFQAVCTYHSPMARTRWSGSSRSRSRGIGRSGTDWRGSGLRDGSFHAKRSKQTVHTPIAVCGPVGRSRRGPMRMRSWCSPCCFHSLRTPL